MKIVCDSCSTKYSISDDKVRGKVFKIRCKKCSHIIVVKGNAEAAPAVAEAPTDAVWHLVVEGDQVGPLSDADVRVRLSRNEISPENYVWKEGFSDWLRLAEVPEFADVAPTSAAVTGELFSDSARADDTEGGEPSGDLGGFFGTGVAGQEAARSGGHTISLAGLSGRNRAGAAEAPEDDAFVPSAGVPSPGEGADLFGAVAPVAAPAESGRVRPRGANGTVGSPGRHDGGRVETLTGQRSENSVLFSLSNLQSLAAPSAPVARPGTVQTTEGSGLIDIRAMAASTMRAPAAGGLTGFGGGDARNSDRNGEDDLPAFGAFSSAAPVLLSIPTSSGPPKWVYALIGLGGLILVAVLVLAFSILGKPVVVEQPAAPMAAPAAESNLPSKGTATATATEKKAEDGAPGANKTIAAADLPPRENGEAGGEKTGDKGGPKIGKTERHGKGKKGGATGEAKSTGGTAVASASAAAPADADKAKAPAKGSLDDLLEGALNARGKSRAKVADDDAPGGKKSSDSPVGGGPLAKAAVVAGMNSVKGKVSACYEKFKVPGMAMVNVVIGKSGKVSSAAVTGRFAGTPTGTCVESAVKSASFPPSDGLTTPYPFSLR